MIGLTLGEPDFDTPTHIRKAAIEAIQVSFTHYPPVAGIPELREIIAKKFERDNGIAWKAENIVVSTGAKQSLYNVILSLVNPGEEVVIVSPFWVTYPSIVELAEGKSVFIQTDIESQFKVTPDQLEAAITDKTRIFMLNSPSNPTGVMYTKEEIEALAKVLKKYPKVVVLSDEIYEYISFGKEHFSIGSIPEMKERTVTVNGFSKGFAMTGWRVGYIGAPKWIAEACEKLQGQVTSGTNSIAMKAAYAALAQDLYPTYAMRDQFRERRDYVYHALDKIEGMQSYLPDGAFYFFPDVSGFFGKKTPKGETIESAEDVCNYLLYEASVAVIPGNAFGAKNCIRMAYSASLETLKEAMHRMYSSLDKLK